MAIIIFCGFRGAAFAAEFGSAENPSIFTLVNLNTQYTMPVIQDDVSLGNLFAGEFGIDIDGVSYGSFCIELDMPIWMNRQYEAVISDLPPAAPWCEIAAVLNNYDAVDAYSGAAMQLAIWKLIYADSSIYSSNTYVEGMANDIIAEVEGACPLMCVDDTVININAAIGDDSEAVITVEVTQDGLPVVGQEIGLEISAGSIETPEDGYVTDFDGKLNVTVDLPDGTSAFSVNATVENFPVKFIDLGDIQNQVMLDANEPCSYSASSDFDVDPGYGDPRGAWYWKKQLKKILYGGNCWGCGHCGGCGHHNNNCQQADYTKAQVESWLPINLFGRTYRNIKDVYKTFTPWHPSMYDRARKQCMATQLNISSGELLMGSRVDTDGDGEIDSTVAEAMSEAAQAFNSGRPREARDICWNINML